MSGPGCLRRCGCSWRRGLFGPGCSCARGRRPARSPSAPRAFGSARRLEARPGPAAADQHRALALPPPTGTAARFSGPSGALHTSGPVVLRMIRLVSRRALALPPPTGTAARFSGPSGALHTSGPVVLRMIRLVRGPPWPCHRRPAPRPGPAAAHGYLGRSHGPSGTAARPAVPSDALLWCACSG